jgi:hypothetical protein
MPCESGYDDSAILGKELQAATRAACDVFKVLREDSKLWGKVVGKLSAGTLAWLQEHDKEDARREKEEKADAERKAAKKRVLGKLTKAEREALRY